MLTTVESKSEKLAAQNLFRAMVRSAWRRVEKRTIAWRPSSIELEIAHNNNLWFGSDVAKNDSGERRFWNSFGQLRRSGNLEISVEINIPIDASDGKVSGFIAKDPESGILLVMHDGGIGGGRKGIGRDAFLEWSSLRPIPVTTSSGKIRHGIIVAVLDGSDDISALEGFVRNVIAFKEAVRAGALTSTPSGSNAGQSFTDYFKEFSGTKSGSRKKYFQYESRHGDVVDELTRWHLSSSLPKGRVVKSAFIDLGIETAGELSVLFEVKTDDSRQCLYTAIGQLSVHSASDRTIRCLVVPDEAAIPTDIAICLEKQRIKVLRFRLSRNAVTIVAAAL